MQQQLEMLADEPRKLARRSDPGTSHEAAARVHEFGQAQRDLILSALRRFGHAGAEQLAAATKLDAYQTRKRLPELREAGFAEPTEKTRLTVSGRKERVWRAL